MRRQFGSLTIIRRGRKKYLRASYQPPIDAAKKWPGVTIPKRVTKNFPTRDRPKAEAWLYAAQRAIETGTWKPDTVNHDEEEADSLLFSTYATKWVDERRKHDGTPLAPGTKEKYRQYLHDHLLPAFGRMRLRDITEQTVRSWWDAYPVSHDGRGLSQRLHCYTLLKGILGTAANTIMPGGGTLIPRDPCTIRISKPRPLHEQVIATDEELREVASCMPDGLGLAVLLSGILGLRRGEVLGLQRRDIDLKGMVLHVRRSAKQTRMGDVWRMELGSTKTPTGVRDIMIPDTLVEPLKQQLLSTGRQPDSLLFHSKKGSIVHVTSLEESWMEARRKVPRLADMHFHDLRHTALTRLAQNGATVAELEHIAGHSDAQTAMHYQHAVSSHERQVIDRAASQASGDDGLRSMVENLSAEDRERLLRLLSRDDSKS